MVALINIAVAIMALATTINARGYDYDLIFESYGTPDCTGSWLGTNKLHDDGEAHCKTFKKPVGGLIVSLQSLER